MVKMGSSQCLDYPFQFFEPIAIIGMAMRLPGRVRNGEDFWNLLCQKRDGLCNIPPGRFNVNGFVDKSGLPGTIPTEKAYFLEDVEIQEFDPAVFSIPKKELERLDPSQRQLLQVAYECMENAGLSSWRGSNFGCYIGCFGEDWQDLNAKETQHSGGYRGTGYGDFVLGNRISYEFDLRGPSMTVKTACSSSMVCLDLACEAIRNGQCDGALVGGASLIFSPTMWLSLHDQGLLSPTGQSKTFDASADGYARGEAVNMILIKRASDAIRDNDPIHAIIRGTSVNTDGRTQGMLVPSPVAQAALIKRTYAIAGIQNMSDTAIFETHGTGTPIGDPLEAQAVGDCFGDRGIVITSVKPNVGHSEGAAGLTSLIKCVLALEHRMVPPNILFRTPNPKIPFQKHQLHVPTEVESWPKGRAERASINCFGIGGVNSHVILESPRQFGLPDRAPIIDLNYEAKLQRLLLFSAYSAASLEKQIGSYRHYAKGRRVSMVDLSYTLANRREHRPYRAYAITGDASTFQVSVSKNIPKSHPRVAWIFTGQGAQWAQMGVDLLDSNATFGHTIRKLDRFLMSLPVPPPWTIENELRKDAATTRVHQAVMGHPLSLALQIGLVDVLRSWGVTPNFILGHSSGEMAAAYASGAITAESAMAAAVFRSSLDGAPDGKGAMAAVGLSREDVLPYLLPGVIIACENSQCSITISGDSDQVHKVIKTIKAEQPGTFTRLLRVEKAFHSHHMFAYGQSYEDHLRPYMQKLSRDPSIPFFSSVTGEQLTGSGKLGPAYWRSNMESPVLFNSALRAALRNEKNQMVLIEVGPHPALSGPIRQILNDLDRRDTHIGTLSRGNEYQESLLQLAGELYLENVPINYSVQCPPGHFLRDLPLYAWRQDMTYWDESRVAHEWRLREHAPHELLGSMVIESGAEPCWRNVLQLEKVPWLKGHQINGRVVFPGAAYIGMIGEALRQLNGEATFSVRNVRIAAARLLEADEAIEFSTTLRPIMIDTSEESPWYTFTISSLNGSQWTRNCYGEARSSMDMSVSSQTTNLSRALLPRKVDERTWFNALDRLGLHLTGMFSGIMSISAATTTHKAAAVIPAQEKTKSRGARYSLHPCSIDKCFQVLGVAAGCGLARNMTTLAIPTFIEEMVISPCATDLQVVASIDRLERGSYIGNISGENSFHLKGYKSSVLGSEKTEKELMITHSEWMPSSDFADLSKHLHSRQEPQEKWSLLEELIILCMIDHLERIKIVDTTQQHYTNFLGWMKTYVERYLAGQNMFITKHICREGLDSEQRLARIKVIVADMATSSWSILSTAIYRLFMAAPAIFSGETHPLSVLREDDILTQVYTIGDTLEFAGAIRLIANTNPQLRVLEIGAGTGGTTTKVLEALKSPYGERLYSVYTYTDISSGFMAAAGQRFADFEIEYAVLDITKDPVEQGFQAASYDLIVCSNVLHATPCLQESLRHVYGLLSPGGRLFLQELCPDAKFTNYIYGFLPGWWLGIEDGRSEEPYISPARWTKELVHAGFQTPEALRLDGDAPYHNSAGIIAARGVISKKLCRVTLLCYEPDGPCSTELRQCLETKGVIVDICLFGETLPVNQEVISLLDLQKPTVCNLDSQGYDILMGYLESHKEVMIWAMPASQIDCQDPRAAMTLGLARTARNELSVNLITVEIDRATSTAVTAEKITRIMFRVRARESNSTSLNPDYEYAVADDEILIPRFHWQTMPDAVTHYRKQAGFDDQGLRRIQIDTPGLLRTMSWGEGKIPVPAEGEVLVNTKAVGLNFRDVLIALGVLDNSTSEMGLEGSGIVTAVGPGVDNVTIGDRVVYMAGGCFTTHVLVPHLLCVKINDSLSFEQGAAVPCVYTTTLLALVDKANLRKGQSVLIQSACGGVGLAAIQIARMIGADIYCTVGSEEKVRFLEINYGLDRSRIFNSRDSSFLPAIMHATNNRGVDVVLNSLSGDLIHASWNCVAEFGAMIEIGKRDFRRRAKLSMEAFEQNRSFIGVDMWQITQVRPETAADLMERSLKLIQSGVIKGPTIAGSFPASQIQEAFRTLKGAMHIGKIVVTFPESLLLLPAVTPKPKPVFRRDRSYLLVGGLGGLGRAVATWMVECGARHLIFMSRSARECAETQDLLEDLRSQACEVTLVTGTVTSVDDVQKTVDTTLKPIAGVINMAMVLKDVGLGQMTFADWTAAVEPKVQGTWNLHQVLPSDLDFFILFSSYSGIVGQLGQANYAAANTFLDAFVQYRHRQGCTASVIDVGVMGEVGFVSQNFHIQDRIEKTGMQILREQHLLDALALACDRSKPLPNRPFSNNGAYKFPSQLLIGLMTSTPISSPFNRVAWKHDIRMAIYHNLDRPADTTITTNSPRNATLKGLLASNSSDKDRTMAIARAVAGALADFLIKDKETVSLDQSIGNLGMDSLVAMEIRTWIRQQTGVDMSMFTILQSPSLLSLGDQINQEMTKAASAYKVVQ
ncbi:putative polyketide synthase [Xylaria scruposa]|nr:putative polyketide synthase [Xylaria scruposa]